MAEPFDKNAYWTKTLTQSWPGASQTIGFKLLSFDASALWCECAFSPGAETLNPGGMVQGGMICAMLDEVMSISASMTLNGPAMAPTLQMTTSFLRPVAAGPLIGKGQVMRAGRQATHTEGWLWNEDRSRLLAHATASCIPRPFETGE